MAVNRVLKQGIILPSFAALTELYEVLSRKQFRRYIDEEDIRLFLAVLTREAHGSMPMCKYPLAATPKTTSFFLSP
jgi:hypothetical protein